MKKFVNISGNTYPVRERLKALGARWNSVEKCWTISDTFAERARAIVAGNTAPSAPVAASNSLPGAGGRDARGPKIS